MGDKLGKYFNPKDKIDSYKIKLGGYINDKYESIYFKDRGKFKKIDDIIVMRTNWKTKEYVNLKKIDFTYW